MTREEYLAVARRRALALVDEGFLLMAGARLVDLLCQREDTRLSQPEQAEYGKMVADMILAGDVQAIRGWIDSLTIKEKPRETIDHTVIKPGKFADPARVPCSDCPLARTTKPGALGGYTPMQYLQVLHGGADLACHMSKGFPAMDVSRSCTGVGMYRANLGLTPWGHALEAVKKVGPNRELVFGSAQEFYLHHMGIDETKD